MNTKQTECDHCGEIIENERITPTVLTPEEIAKLDHNGTQPDGSYVVRCDWEKHSIALPDKGLIGRTSRSSSIGRASVTAS